MKNKFKNIAELVRVNRKVVKLSQRELGQALGYKNAQFISNVERELCSIPAKSIAKAAELLDVKRIDIVEAMLLDERKRLEIACSIDMVATQEAATTAIRH